jgi:hypothetical protein
MTTFKTPVYNTPEKDVQIFRDSLSQKSMEIITNLTKQCLEGNEYTYTNFQRWNPVIVGNSNEIKVVNLNDDYPEVFQIISRELFSRYNINPEGLYLNIHIMNKDCCVCDHDDGLIDYAFTIYLNTNWEFTDGGLFQYIKDDVTYGILPEYNKMVIISNVLHRVTCINKEKCRITLQGFYRDKCMYKGKSFHKILYKNI